MEPSDSPHLATRRGRPPRAPETTSALYVRLPTAVADRLSRAALDLRTPKRDLVAALVTRHLDPDDGSALDRLRRGEDTERRVVVEPPEPGLTVGRHSFRPAAELEVLTAAQLADLLQVEEAVVVDLAERGELPGRRVGTAWRFARAAVLIWLADGPASTR